MTVWVAVCVKLTDVAQSHTAPKSRFLQNKTHLLWSRKERIISIHKTVWKTRITKRKKTRIYCKKSNLPVLDSYWGQLSRAVIGDIYDERSDRKRASSARPPCRRRSACRSGRFLPAASQFGVRAFLLTAAAGIFWLHTPDIPHVPSPLTAESGE